MPEGTFAIGVSLPAKTRAMNTKEIVKALVEIHITLVLSMNHMLTLPLKQAFVSPPSIRMVFIGFGEKIYHFL